MTGANLSLNVRANADLSIAQNFDRDVYSGGKVALDATIRGDIPKPLINGQLTLQNATFSTVRLPLGISNANGAIIFNGNSATIRTLTAESGGGKLTVTGFASRLAIAGALYFTDQRLECTPQAAAGPERHGRCEHSSDRYCRYQPSHREGDSEPDQLCRPERYRFHADAIPTAGTGAEFFVHPVEQRSSICMCEACPLHDAVQSSHRRPPGGTSICASEGPPPDPGVLGRIDVSSGKLIFFGNNYTVDTGTIAFYNPLRIEPVLDVSLVTQARSVNVTVRVTGAARTT